MYEHDYSVQGDIMLVDESIKHQDIGGKQIVLEFSLPKEEVFSLAAEGNWANVNFLKRHINEDMDPQEVIDMVRNFDSEVMDASYLDEKLYYGKVNGLGYVVTASELKEIA